VANRIRAELETVKYYAQSVRDFESSKQMNAVTAELRDLEINLFLLLPESVADSRENIAVGQASVFFVAVADPLISQRPRSASRAGAHHR
jgi:hypothetical protein